MMIRALALTALLLAPSIATDASDDRPRYWPQVREARQWLKAKMSAHQFHCLHHLWDNESSWRVKALNRSSGAYGIPQSLPGWKMRKAEEPRWGKRWDDWRTDALVQVRWGRWYVRGRYGTPCNALRFQDQWGWY